MCSVEIHQDNIENNTNKCEKNEEENSECNNTECQNVNIDNSSSEIQSLNHVLNLPDKYLKSSPFHGIAYQLKLLMLFIMNSMNKTIPFRIATEMVAADKFNDVVLHYSEKGNPIYRFVQVKHKQDNTKTINLSDLLADAKDSEYSLQKYFISYNKIKDNEDFKETELKDFIIFTNINIDTELQKYFHLLEENDNIIEGKRQENMLGKRYKLKLDSFPYKTELISKLKETSELYILAKRLVNHLITKQTIDFKDLFKNYYDELVTKVIDLKTVNSKSIPADKDENIGKYVASFHKSFLEKEVTDKALKYFRNLLFEAYIKKLNISNCDEDFLINELRKKQFILSKNFFKTSIVHDRRGQEQNKGTINQQNPETGNFFLIMHDHIFFNEIKITDRTHLYKHFKRIIY